ncbi:MAG: hypothetical protein HY370_00585 [Proteobacteria bacterium]|nr:hypothetical protein [Pseudomonadota bacterium]
MTALTIKFTLLAKTEKDRQNIVERILEWDQVTGIEQLHPDSNDFYEWEIHMAHLRENVTYSKATEIAKGMDGLDGITSTLVLKTP